MRRFDHDPVVFLTMHSNTPLETSRYIFKLANAMHESGIETMVLNIGQALPRPEWILPAFRSVEEPAEFRLILDRMPPHILIGTNPETAFLAHDDARFTGAPTFYLMSGSAGDATIDLIQSHILSTAVCLGELLAPVKWIAESLEQVVTSRVHRIGVATDPGLHVTETGDRSDVIFAYDPARPESKIVDGCRSAVRQSAAKLRAVGFGYGQARVKGATYVALPWADENSADRSRLYSTSAALVHPTANAGLELSALDAMACECPVVAVPSVTTETICVDGENCLFASDDSEQAITNAILRIQDDHPLSARLVEGGRRTVRDMTWQTVLDNLPTAIREQQRDSRALGLGAVNWHKQPDRTPA